MGEASTAGHSLATHRHEPVARALVPGGGEVQRSALDRFIHRGRDRPIPKSGALGEKESGGTGGARCGVHVRIVDRGKMPSLACADGGQPRFYRVMRRPPPKLIPSSWQRYVSVRCRQKIWRSCFGIDLFLSRRELIHA